ncbi:laccase [Trametes cingulata]|nr:laccase [Trametes cingulata]
MLLRPLAHLAALSLVLKMGEAIGPVTDLSIVDAAVTPDGYTRQAVLPGGTFPGPLVTGNKNDNFQINVLNELTNETMLTGTTIHWHGIFQHNTAWADGTAFVSQCPISPSTSFLYNFTAVGQAGTFWYHSHYMTQYCDGLRGPLVIYDPEDPYADMYDVDNETTVLTLADWLHTAARLGPQFPTPNSTLINGAGRYPGGPAWPLSVITVEQGKRYRFRMINMACEPNYNFTIDGHNMTIIEADGEYTEPLTVDFIQIFAAQRYSFILNATQPVDNYWIRANPSVALTDGQGFAGGINSAILRYVGAPETDPTTTQTPSVIPLSEADLHALVDPAAPGEPFPGGADVNIQLDFTFNMTGDNLFYANNVTYVSPSVPVLLQILNGTRGAMDLMPTGSIYYLPPNKSIEISFPMTQADAAGSPHPFHLHGHSFSVVKGAGQATPNYANPVKRDTVSIGEVGDNVTIRFMTDNPGPWFLHCHIDWHLEAGMAVILAEDVGDIPTDDPAPTQWYDLCPEWNTTVASGGM